MTSLGVLHALAATLIVLGSWTSRPASPGSGTLRTPPQAQLEGGARVPTAGGRSGRVLPGLVVFLPGGTFGGTGPEERARWVLAQVDAPARRLGLRVLVPVPGADAPSVPFLEPAGEAAVLGLVRAELRAGRADRTRVLLAGYGVGATAALGLAARHRDVFAAVAAWSGSPAPLWERDDRGGRTVVDLAEDPVPGLRGTPVYLWTGRADGLIDRECLRLFVERMRLASARSRAWRLVWDEGPGGHELGDGGPEPGLRFLAGHRRRERP